MRESAFALGFALLAWHGSARGAEVVHVRSGDVVLADIVENAPAELAAIVICAAPPPGSSRLVSRDEVRQKLAVAGAETDGLALPRVVRVTADAERWTVSRVAEAAASTLGATLPSGVTLVKTSAIRGAVVRPGTSVARVRVQIPHRTGQHQLSAIAELEHAGETIARIPVSVVLEVAEGAFEPVIARGGRATVYVQQGAARVGAVAIALGDADLGAETQFRVASTGRVVKARVVGPELAQVVSP